MLKLLTLPLFLFLFVLNTCLFGLILWWQLSPVVYSYTFFYLCILSIEFGLLAMGFSYLLQDAALTTLKKEVAWSSFGFLLAIITVLCPVCNVGILLSLGIALGLGAISAYLPYFALATILVLAYTIFLLDGRLRKGCTACRIR